MVWVPGIRSGLFCGLSNIFRLSLKVRVEGDAGGDLDRISILFLLGVLCRSVCCVRGTRSMPALFMMICACIPELTISRWFGFSASFLSFLAVSMKFSSMYACVGDEVVAVCEGGLAFW